MHEVTTMRGVDRVPQPLGPRLRVARENAGLTQADLAQRLGVQVESVAAWESDARSPRANRLVMIAGITNVSLPWLLEGREDEYMETQGAATFEALRTELDQLDALLCEARTTVENVRARVDVIALRVRRGDADAV